MPETRRLKDLRSIGPATLRDFADLGVTSVADLATRDPDDLYERLAELKKPELEAPAWTAAAATSSRARSRRRGIRSCRRSSGSGGGGAGGGKYE